MRSADESSSTPPMMACPRRRRSESPEAAAWPTATVTAVADSGVDARPRRAHIWRAGLTLGSAFLVVGAVVTAFVLRDGFVAAHRTVGWVVACAVVAMLIDPLVDFVDRLLPRWIAVILVLLVVLGIVASVAVGLATELLDSIDQLQASAPEAAAELEERYDWLASSTSRTRVQDVHRRPRRAGPGGRRLPGGETVADVHRDRAS